MSQNRRKFIQTSFIAGAAFSTSVGVKTASAQGDKSLRIGLMTWTLGKDWDVDTIIHNCKETQWEHAELRTTHAHGVEVDLTKQERDEVRRKFEDAGIALSLASAFAYHWADSGKLKEHIEGTKKYTRLAHDIGARGIRVFPNSINVDGVSKEKTMEQIARSAAEVARYASDFGVQIRLSNHGNGTNRVPVIKQILDMADSPHLTMNWNCDSTDVEDPGFEANFHSVSDRISNIHMHDLTNTNYPYRKLFSLLRESGYQGYCDAEVGQSCEPIKFMEYYRALFLALQNELY